MRSRAPDKDRRGLALPSTIFALVAIAVLAAGLFTVTDLAGKSVRNRVSAVRASQVAEAGVNHTLGLMRGSLRMQSFTRILRGFDNVVPSADDSLMIGWGLVAADQIPLAGQTFQGATYFVTVRDDAADGDANAATDLNGRVRVRCRAVTADGATAEVEAVIGSVPMPAVAVDGNLTFTGTSAVIGGACGSAHANGSVTSSGLGPTVGVQVSATGTVNGNYRRPDGSAAPELNGQAEIPIPDLNPMSYCAGAEFRLLSTGGATTGAGVVIPVPVGWVYTAGTQTWTGTNINVDGTYCVQGNVSIGGNTGSAATPRRMTVLATGSIAVAGTPVIIPDHDDGILFLAGGDLTVAGNPTAGVNSYTGMMYAGAQCGASGNATAFGQLLCANGPMPAGATELIAASSIGGNFSLTFDCGANVFNKRRILYWYPRIGT